MVFHAGTPKTIGYQIPAIFGEQLHLPCVFNNPYICRSSMEVVVGITTYIMKKHDIPKRDNPQLKKKECKSGCQSLFLFQAQPTLLGYVGQ